MRGIMRRVIASSDLPTPPFCQVLGDLVVCLSHGSSPSAKGRLALAENEPQIKSFAYVGISDKKPRSA
jgi:hypothetical protein